MQNNQEKYLKTILCQLKPIFKEKTSNIARVKESLKHYSQKDKFDVILLPEMSFTGYNFENYEDAFPLTVKCGEGQQFQFAREEAKRLKSYFIFGYMERQQKDGKTKLYNSAAVLNREGQLVLNYRKFFLYFADSLWCQQGNSFKSLTIQNTKGQKFKCAIGICMDLNPKNFTSGQFELADFIQKEKAQVLLFLTNWIDHQPQSTQDSTIISMYEYWLHRLRPLLNQKNIKKRPLLFLAADRVGTQHSFYDKKEITFFGCSCGIMVNPNYIVGKLDKRKEGYLIIQGKLPKEWKN